MASDAAAAREGAYQSWLAAAGVGLLPFVVVILVMVAQFRGLREPNAIEQAVAARRLAAGQGFTTPVVYPRSLAYNPSVTAHPELRCGPLSVLPAAILVKLAGENDGRTVAFSSMLAWLLAVWLTLWLGRILFGPRAGLLGAMLFCFSPGTLGWAVSGDGVTWAWPLLLLLWAAVAWPGGGRARPFVAGLLMGLAMLVSSSLALPLLLGVLPALAFTAPEAPPPRSPGEDAAPLRPQRQLGAPALAALVVLLVCTPWLVRNQRVAGTPFPGVHSYGLMALTEALPGQSVERLYLDPGAGLGGFAMSHKRQLLRKFVGGLYALRGGLPQDFEWPVLGLALASLLTALGGGRGRARRALTAALLWQIGLLSLGGQEYRLLGVWAPLLALHAAAFATERLANRFTAPQPGRRRDWPAATLNRWAAVGLVALVAVPGLAPQLFSPPPERSHPSAPNHALLKELVAPGEVIATDDPWSVAWLLDRTAVWLPQNDTDLEAVAKLAPLRALYFSRAQAAYSQAERGDWWSWALNMPAGYREFVPVESRVPGERLLINPSLPRK